MNNNIRIFKILALISYFFVILRGSMIGLPLGCWLFMGLFTFGISQIYSLVGLAGFIYSLVLFRQPLGRKTLILDVLCVCMLSVPLVVMLSSVRIELFNYWLFILPGCLFAGCFFVYFKRYVRILKELRRMHGS